MSNQGDAEPTWTDIAPEKLVSETEVPEQAAEFEELTSSWIDDHAQYFDLFDWESMKERYWVKKAFNEAGSYLLNALNHDEDDHTSTLKELVIERVNDRRFSQLILRNPKDIHLFAYPILYADYVNSLETDVAAAFKQVLEQGEFWSSERLAYRLLEFCYLSRINNVPCEHKEDAIVQYSLLNHQPNIVRADYIDVYSLTHDVMFSNHDKLFYNTCINAGDREFLHISNSYDISNVLRGLILRYMAEHNLDITLELLLSGILQRQISREMVQLVLSWALEKVSTNGNLPGPPEESMYLVSSPKKMGARGEASWNYKYENEQEAIWAKSYHTYVVAGMTARVLKRDWDKLNNRTVDNIFEDHSFRQDSTRLGQLLKSLAQYDLAKGSHQIIELAKSPVSSEFSFVFGTAVDFLKAQRTQEGEFGYWAAEENLYVNNGKSRESFRSELVKPASEACQKALNVVETSSQK